jgi:predicted ester cyclase
MPEDKASIMRELVNAMAAAEIDKTLTFFSEDGSVVNPFGTYKGKDAIRRALIGMAKTMKDVKITESGNGIIVQGDKAFFEHTVTGTMEGKRFEFLAMCAYEFEADKIKNVRMVYDRLGAAQQVVSGWPARPLVNMVVKQSEKAMK